MYFLLFLLFIVVLCNSSNRETARTGEQLLSGVAAGVVFVIVLFALVLGFEFFPTVTVWLLGSAAAVAVALLIRWIYKRFFSPQARLNAAYARMNKRYYALSWHVVQLELKRYAPDDVSWAVERGEQILKRCREEHERYSKLPPETGSDAYRTQFYIDDIQRLETKLRGFSTPK